MESRGVKGGNEYVREFLRKDNYKDWSMQMKTYLMANEIWYVVDDDEAVYRVESDIKAWDVNNSKALHLILMSCGSEAFALLNEDEFSAKEAWDTLYENYAPKHPEISVLITQDIALDLFKRCPNLIFKKDKSGDTVAYTLAMKPYGFHTRNRLRCWQRWIYKCLRVQPRDVVNQTCINVQNSEEDGQSNIWDFTKWVLNQLGRLASNLSSLLGITDLYKLKLAHAQASELLTLICHEIESFDIAQMKEADIRKAVLEAARTGFVEFITSVTQANPDLVCTSHQWKKLFRTAIQHRQERVFSLIYGLDSKHEVTSYYNEFGNSIWHTAGELAHERLLNIVPGAALKMQRELQWFKEVGETLTETTRKLLNNEGKTAREVFTHQHKDLLTAGEKWMKDTATSCSLVGALIVTVMFTAAFTVPGGTHQEEKHPQQGYPVLLTEKLFKVFVLSDVMSFSSATTSVLVFLGILTSRYAEEDFLKSLPRKMIVGLATLWFSIVAMMVCFCSTLLIMFRHERWIVAPLVLLTSLPVGLVAWIKFPLLVEICKCTYGRSIFKKKTKNWVYGDTSAASNYTLNDRNTVYFSSYECDIMS